MGSYEHSTGYRVPIGTYQDAVAMVGRRTDVRFGQVAVNEAMIRHYCAMIEDGNPGYWDEEFARPQWGAVVSPPGLLTTWVMPLVWAPGAGEPEPMLPAQVPLPGDSFINVENDTEFMLPVRVGDRLNAVEELVDVSAEKRTRLGRGHFVTTEATYRRQDGAVVAVSRNVLFRFARGSAAGGPPEPGE